jgi:hypothetical protein
MGDPWLSLFDGDDGGPPLPPSVRRTVHDTGNWRLSQSYGLRADEVLGNLRRPAMTDADIARMQAGRDRIFGPPGSETLLACACCTGLGWRNEVRGPCLLLTPDDMRALMLKPLAAAHLPVPPDVADAHARLPALLQPMRPVSALSLSVDDARRSCWACTRSQAFKHGNDEAHRGWRTASRRVGPPPPKPTSCLL